MTECRRTQKGIAASYILQRIVYIFLKKVDTVLKKNAVVKLNIEDLTDLGFGVGRVDGMVVFVSDTVPGDECEVKIIKASSSFMVGRVERMISPSPLRVKGRCPNKECKSCAYRNISYCEEARLKESGVRHLFDTDALGHTATTTIITSPEEYRYRNKAQYPVAMVNGEIKVGFYAPKSHRVTPVSDCPLTPKIFSEICELVTEFMDRNHISVYDEISGRGLVRHIYLRRGEVSGEVLLTLVVNGKALPCADELVSMVREKYPEVVGVLLNLNRDSTNVVLGEEYITLYGREYIYDTLAGVKLKITAPAFYQVNHDCAELLYAKAKELADLRKGDTLLDLYCGAGSIGLSMAGEVEKLIGIEIVASAVECAKENALANGIMNAEFYVGDAKDTEKLLEHAEAIRGEKIEPDVVILDPPRGGCDERLVRFVSSLSPRKIVYISCNPKTLARDVERFIEDGYLPGEVYPVDMFPMTGHVESVTCLTRE